MLQNLILHRKSCNHPLSVRDSLTAPLRASLTVACKKGITESSGKLQGLVDLLRQCEIIASDESDEKQKPKSRKQQEEGQYEGLLSLPVDSAEAQAEAEPPQEHRALIFCQM